MDRQCTDADWDGIGAVLEELERVLRTARDRGAKRLRHLRTNLASGDRSSVLAELTSGDMWNHMGSFFDRSLSDSTLDQEFRRAQIRLADELVRAGVATEDVTAWAAVLRTLERQDL